MDTITATDLLDDKIADLTTNGWTHTPTGYTNALDYVAHSYGYDLTDTIENGLARQMTAILYQADFIDYDTNGNVTILTNPDHGYDPAADAIWDLAHTVLNAN